MSTFPDFAGPLNKYTVNELKNFLRSRSLNTGGLKIDLIKRLTEALKKENESKNNENKNENKCDDESEIQPQKANDHKINTNNHVNKKDIQNWLESIGFSTNYIQRAFKVFENNFSHSYSVEVITEIIVRLMNKEKYINNKSMNNKSRIEDTNNIPFEVYMTLQQALQLKVNDRIDHRDQAGHFIYATISEKQGTNLKIHYEGWSRKWDTWSDFKTELHRFAKAGSISKRPCHRFKTLKKGDYIDINPLHRHPGWKCGKIRRFDSNSGQIQVCYEVDDNYLYWIHLDNKEEIAEFTSKTGTINKTQIEILKQCNNNNSNHNNNNNKRNEGNDFDDDEDDDIKMIKESKRNINDINGNDVIMDKHSNSKKRKLENNMNNRPKKRQKVSANNNGINKISSPLNKLRRPSLLENTKCNTFDCDALNEKYLAIKQKENRLNQQILEQKALLDSCKQKNTEINNLMDDYKKENEEIKKLTEKRLNAEINAKHDLNQKILQQNNLLNIYKMENEALKKNNDAFETNKIDTLNLDELNELKLKMQQKIKLIEETEKEFINNTLKCVACMNKAKNISFIDGCSHIALCDECESKSIIKLCPLCQTPYKNVKKINF